MSGICPPRARRWTWLILACVLADQGAPPAAEGTAEVVRKVPLAEAEKRLREHIATIEARQKDFDATISDRAEELFRAAFQKHGASGEHLAKRLKSAPDLGCQSVRQNFYAPYLLVLRSSLKIVQDRGFASEEDLKYYDERMTDWLESEPRMRRHLLDRLDPRTAGGRELSPRRGAPQGSITPHLHHRPLVHHRLPGRGRQALREGTDRESGGAG
ncbi:MAG: hypothetical protein FD180_1509 [Planctomycetota bacterium]|nr:MAG: hypothetical protein FD180_1509 [Planctomycetota bacterium]